MITHTGKGKNGIKQKNYTYLINLLFNVEPFNCFILHVIKVQLDIGFVSSSGIRNEKLLRYEIFIL